MDRDRILAHVVEAILKDKDLMQDTGGVSKGRKREPELKPSRTDLEKRYRKRSLKPSERDEDTQEDPDIKTSDENEFQGVLFSQGLEDLFKPSTYSENVRNSLLNILMHTRGVSEKAFSAMDDLIAETKALWENDSEIAEIVDRFERQGSREDFCAEYIYSRLQ